MEFLLAKESLSHCKATLRARDVCFNAGSLTSSDILALVVATVGDYFYLVGSQYFFGSCSCWRQQSEVSASVGHLLLNNQLVLGIDGYLRVVTDTHLRMQGHCATVRI